jgi:hypothetical protein
VSDAGLGHLKNLTTLKTLILSETQVPDRGLEHLMALGTLGTLVGTLDGTLEAEGAYERRQLTCRLLIGDAH